MQQCWNKTFPYDFPPFQSDKSNSGKHPSRKDRANDNSFNNMAITTLVSYSVRDFIAIPIAMKSVRSSRKQTPFSSKQETDVSGLEGYRKSLEMEGISSIAARLTSKSRRPGSIAS